MSFHKSKCEFWYTYRFTVCILEQCIFIHYFRLTSHLLFTGAVFVPIITYYGGSTMFSRLCGTVYSVNNLEFRLWAPFNTGGEMQFDRSKNFIPGGSAYTGPFASSFQTGFVRIRAWRLCDFPRANFSSDGVYDITSKGAYFIQYFYS